MKLRDRAIAVCIAALAIAGGGVWWWDGGGATAPEFRVATIGGATVAAGGAPTLVTFWATDCITCRHEAPHLAQLHRDSGGRLRIIAVAMPHDDEAAVREFVRSRELPYHVAMDSAGRLARLFGDVRLTPTTFLIAPDNRIVLHTIGAVDLGKVRALVDKMHAG